MGYRLYFLMMETIEQLISVNQLMWIISWNFFYVQNVLMRLTNNAENNVQINCELQTYICKKYKLITWNVMKCWGNLLKCFYSLWYIALISPVHLTIHLTVNKITCFFSLTSVFVFSQGRHVKTGQLAAIKVMDVTEVRINSRYYFSLTSQHKHERQSLCRGYNGRQIRHTMMGFISVLELDNFTLSLLMTSAVRMTRLRDDTILPFQSHFGYWLHICASI